MIFTYRSCRYHSSVSTPHPFRSDIHSEHGTTDALHQTSGLWRLMAFSGIRSLRFVSLTR